MNVLHISKFPPSYKGGIEKVVSDTINGLKEKAEIESITVLCFSDRNNEEKKGKLKIVEKKMFANIFSQPLSFGYLTNIYGNLTEYDIIHLHLPNPLATLPFLCKNSNAQIIVHWHNDIVSQKLLKTFYKPVQNKILSDANKIIVTSPHYLKGSSDLKRFADKCEVVPIGISKEDINYDKDAELELEQKYEDKFVVFSVGRLAKYKGFEYLIRSAQYLNEDFQILIGGSGNQEKKLKNIINELEVEDKVKLVGRIPDSILGSYYSFTDIFCMSSITKNEGFGIVQLEAMLFGKPVITTDIPGSGIKFGNIDGKTGVVVPPKNPKAIAEAIKRLEADQDFYNRCANNSQQRVSTVFNKEKMIDNTFSIYHSALSK